MIIKPKGIENWLKLQPKNKNKNFVWIAKFKGLAKNAIGCKVLVLSQESNY